MIIDYSANLSCFAIGQWSIVARRAMARGRRSGRMRTMEQMLLTLYWGEARGLTDWNGGVSLGLLRA